MTDRPSVVVGLTFAAAFMLALVLAAATPATALAQECQECFQWGPIWDRKHYFSDQGDVRDCNGDCHTNIVETSCGGHDHPNCRGDNDPVADLGLSGIQELVDSGSAPELGAFLRKHERSVTLLAARNAIQITGCDGITLVAHVPLTSKQVASLTQ